MKLGVRTKLVMIIGILVFTVVGLHTYFQIASQRSVFQSEINKRTQLMKFNLMQRAANEASTLGRKAEEALASYNFYSLTQDIRRSVTKTPLIEQAILVDNQQAIFVHSSNHSQQQNTFTGLEYANSFSNKLDFFEEFQVKHWLKDGIEEKTTFEVPISLGEAPWGILYLTFTLEQLNQQISDSIKQNEKSLYQQTLKTFYISVTLFLLAYLVTSKLSKTLVRPIVKLSQLTNEVSQGNFSATQTIKYKGNDELGTLNESFSEMSSKLRDYYQQLEDYNQTLELKVKQRTEELNQKNETLIKTMHDLEESQQQLIHSEKMAALGQLIAGIAHEINTPLGAIQASVGNSNKYMSSFTTLLPDFLKSTSKQEQDFLCLLLQNANHTKNLTTREERKLKRQLTKELEANNIEKSDQIAELLADIASDLPIEALTEYLTLPNAYGIIELAHGLTGIGRNCETIHTAVGRASKVVFALKHFTHHDNSGNMITSDINKGIQTVLILYHNLLKKGCSVVEQYGDIPEINCYPDELNQVWTNLIHNALHAMQSQGTLTINTRLINDFIEVSFVDDGPGIPAEIQPKIFDSFFTTKPAGEGSGLGLGICQRIADKHEGNIHFTSEPGRTCFTVMLPASNG